MRMGNARAEILMLQECKMDFLLTSSNYTTQIEYGEVKDKFVQTMQSNRTFACFAKLKSQLKDKIIPEVRKEDVLYFHHNFDRDIYIDTVYNIDLKSAYATILFNDSFIDEKTYRYICESKKQERLASVGMLASRKKVFQFKSGSPISEQEIVSDKSGLFFYAVKRTYEIMSTLQKACGSNYLYTWVDGIYFLPDEKAKRYCLWYLKQHHFNASFDVLTEFEVKIREDTTVVTFKKDGKRKVFNLPSPMTEFKRIMMDAVLRSVGNKEKSGIHAVYENISNKNDKSIQQWKKKRKKK